MARLYRVSPFGDLLWAGGAKVPIKGSGLDRWDADVLTVLGEEGEDYGLTASQLVVLMREWQRAGDLEAKWPRNFEAFREKAMKHLWKVLRKGLAEEVEGKPVVLDLPTESESASIEGFPSAPGAKSVLEELGFEIHKRPWEGLSEEERLEE